LGTGPGGGGTGEDTLGTGTLNTIGSAGRESGGGSDYGSHVGMLTRPRHTIVPEVIPGRPNVHGSLDKEIIRRIVHQHMNEVKFCYDQELARKPTLAGRISVQFAISPVGQVITSVMQSTSMDDARVENCVVNAVRRWEFPKPTGGGIAIVLYPFSFTSPES
jgi:ribosome-binding factor A